MAKEPQVLEPVQKNILIPLSALYPSQRNYRSHPESQIKMLKASLERFGQVRSIVCQPNADGSYTILAGHGIVQAAQALVDVDTHCYERFSHLRADLVPESWDRIACEAYIVADNNLNQHAEDDTELLVQLLQEQQDAGYDLASLGSDEETLRQMLQTLGDEILLSSDDGENNTDTQQSSEKGSLLALLDVTLAEPRHEVHTGDIWTLGRHVLLCVHVFRDWPIWTQYLRGEQTLFLPFPGPMAVLSDKGASHTLVLVQPDTYIAGHILDRYTDIHGESSVIKRETMDIVLEEDTEEEEFTEEE